MNSKNSETSDPHRLLLLLNLMDEINLQRSDKYVNLWKLSINIKKQYENNKYKISALTWSKEFELSNRSYFASDIQNYFEYILDNEITWKH